MEVDYVLILAAGKGTRMGEIGKRIPKVIWPIFNKSILELEILYAQKYVNSNIFVNLHHRKDQIHEFIKAKDCYKNIQILIETEVLDIGGAIHNLAKQVGYKGKLLVLNCDQFIMLDDSLWNKVYLESETRDIVLLTNTVNAKDKYNATIEENNQLIEIRPNSKLNQTSKHETYTGMSLINLESLTPSRGESKFFETVADYKNLNVGVLNADNANYWDFGTSSRYYSSMFEILNKWDHDLPFINFLKENKALEDKYVSPLSYASNFNEVIDLANNTTQIDKTIYLNNSQAKVPEQPCIVWDELIEFVDPLSF